SKLGWARVVLGFACVAAVVVAVLIVGPPSSTQQTSRRVITVEKGVVQSTVSASGSLEPAMELNVNFKQGGTLLATDVRAGAHVYQGQLLAELDPQAANVAVQQAQANLDAANAKLAQVEADPSGTAAAAAGSTGASAAATATTTAAAAKPKAATTTTTPATPAVSPATQAANVAAAQASVASAELSLKSAEIGLGNTRLYAPANGTIATLSAAQPGDTISAGSTGAATPAAASGTTGAGTGATGGAGSTGAAASSGSGASSSSAFIVLVDLSGMDLVVPLSEADITKVRVGQPASVTVNAIPSADLAAHVTAVATLPTTSAGVVSYNVTLHLDQLHFGLLPGMTASTQIVVSQAQGAVSLPSSAISRTGGQSTVTVVKGGKDVVEPIVTGIVGDSATQVVSGLSGGEQVVISTSTSLGSSGAAGAATGRLGGGGLGAAAGLGGGGGGFGGGGGGGAVRRGG
ncbi:MAG TPA: biotin/lipoyl-binding protein, partial [Solirubrobacteraceae bacterium]|nr:biotin/lipoyl-binding protein [Solirubrobacteraceae bacterium]